MRHTVIALLLLLGMSGRASPVLERAPQVLGLQAADGAGSTRSQVVPPRPVPTAAGADQVGGRVPGRVAPYTVNASLSSVANIKQFSAIFPVTRDQKALLRRNLFACTPTQDLQLFHVYENNEYHNLPSFVTSDLVLQLYHCFFDYVLRTAEQRALLPALERLTAGLLADAKRTASASPPGLRSAAIKNVAFLGVAARELGLRVTLPTAATSLVAKERKLIAKHQGYAVGAIFPYKIDYSQFIPRGHYTRSPALKRYFMAMMWYGLAPFATRFNDLRRCDDAIRMGLLLSRTLKRSGLATEWERIYEPTAFLVGSADDLTPSEWQRTAESVYGARPAMSAYGEPRKLDSFVTAVEKLRAAGIQAKSTDAPMPHPKHQLRLMGQRYIPDSEVLQETCAPLKRMFPSGLDVFAALGSKRAIALLDKHADIYNAVPWLDYPQARDKMVRKFAATPPATWRSNVYWGWLDTLRRLTGPFPTGYPSFMRNEAWQDKSLNTGLASWTELRHDTILYGKQSAVECGGDGEERIPKGYVEPNPGFFGRLLDLARQTRIGLNKRQLLAPELNERFGEVEGLLLFLKRAAEKELRNEQLTHEEYSEIRHIGGKIEYLTLATAEGGGHLWNLLDMADRDMALVADVHTCPPTVLQEGVGRANEILVIVPIGRKLYLTRGAVFSYYEFKYPMADRLTDEKWRRILKGGGVPDPPVWTKSFLTQPRRRTPADGRLEAYSSGC